MKARYLGCDVDAAKLGSMTDEELDRLDDEIKKMSYWLQNKQKAYLREMKSREFTRYTRLCELLPEPIKNYRKAVLGFLSDIDAKASASFEPPVKPGGFLGAVMGFEVGLTKELPKDLIVGTLKALLDPVGSVLGFLESIDYNNSNNFVNQTVNAWQSGDSYSRGRIVGNATGQVALMVTPVIIKKFPKVSAGLGETGAAEAGVLETGAVEATSELATIGEEAGVAVRGAEGIIPGMKLIHGEPRNLTVHPGKQGKHIVGHNNYKVALEKGKTPSIFYGTAEDAQRLVNEFAGTGQVVDKLGTRERVNFEKVIGIYVDEATGESLETTWETIRYAKDGVHIVPSKPDSY